MSVVAKGFALPHEMPPMRLPSFPALERTSTLSLNSTMTASCEQVTRGLLTRQASFPFWLEHAQDAIYSFHPQVTWKAVGQEAMREGEFLNFGTGNMSYSAGTIMMQGGTTSVGYPYLGVDPATGPGNWFFAPEGWEVGVVYTGTPFSATDSIHAVFDKWTGPGNYAPQSVRVPFGHVYTPTPPATDWGLIVVLDAGWYRLSAIAEPGGLTGGEEIQVAVAVGSGLQYYKPSPSRYPIGFASRGAVSRALAPALTSTAFSFSSIPFSNTRLTALAVLFTNVTKAINKEGTVQAARLNPEVFDVFGFTAKTFNDIHPAEKYFFGLEKGFYTYAPPSTDLSNFWDYVIRASSDQQQVAPLYRLDNSAMVNAFTFADPDGGTALAVNLDYHIEFRNSSQLWPIGLSSMTLETLHQSQLSLVTAGFFFDNPDHKWILEKISRAWKVAKPLLRLHPAGAAAVTAVKAIQGQLLNRKVSQPQPTTMQVAVPRRSARKRPAKGSGRRVAMVRAARGARVTRTRKGALRFDY